MFTQATDTTPAERSALSLLDLNRSIRQAINRSFPQSCWIQAETSDVRVNASSGHCYLEFIEKQATSGQLVAKARGTIWAKTFHLLKPYFEKETGQRFGSGLKVLVKVMIDYHELYGFNLTVTDIDPTYTLGDMVRKRMEIIRQLQEEGVFSLNKELPFPTLPQRIAVITSATAAGYEDFLNQLVHNKAGYPFYIKLFPALMQGEKTEMSIIAALDHLYHQRAHFDVLVIIRGGGSTADLSCFDSYLLATHCAQFPLPIITGIGHERDDTVLDMVAHTRMKTPTAVAEFLIGQMNQAAEVLAEMQQHIQLFVTDHLLGQKNFLQLLGTRLPSLVSNRLERNRNNLQGLTGRLPALASSLFSRHAVFLDGMQSRLTNGVSSLLTENNRQIQLSEQFIKMSSPEYILKRGYSLTMQEGRIIKQASELKPGDRIVSRFSDGERQSIVE
ncbi:exodeoxyribonuclease VII large subunit [Parabacteroides sp. 52]|uniref:exodeoxyribonuclease VII large subunit n=1 Tax=unclassified Parabacteroides TaxID=2649774 RepID=UPI0013D52515|nr:MULTISPECIES: exodeoxyribonuclease VII large subunit [unclassified Parabacteroides]MDH6534669.1 exodeoxyribonuclease VII large subunit [Parabacteroides sp. PM5-20]NDV56135.1 exodeoxyribonuclease VII large subunit [Parabacteroides sp. 52]